VRKLFAALASLFAISASLQLYFAALGEFSTESADLFNIHGTNGRIILPLLCLLVIVSAALARAGRNTIVLAVVAFVLIFLQTALFLLAAGIFGYDEESKTVPIGLGIIVLSAMLAQRAWASAMPKKVGS
jgi:Family of unknown function (DUF6220)